MAGVKLISVVIEIMAKELFEKRIQCPVCESEKEPKDWICPACFKTYGNGLVLDVQKAVRKAVNKVEDEAWEKLLEITQNLLSAPDKPEGVEDKDLVEALKPKFKGVQEGTIFAALHTVRQIIEEEAKEAARKAEHEDRWQTALSAVRGQFLNGTKIELSFFRKNRVSFNGNGSFISENMMKAACVDVIRERKRAERSQITAAFNSRLEEIGFVS